jgi:uncharacterized DUF497 family protein
MTQDRFDPDKDAANREKHNLPLGFGDRILEDDSHPMIPSVREIDGEERFKVASGRSCSPAFSFGEANCPASSR